MFPPKTTVRRPLFQRPPNRRRFLGLTAAGLGGWCLPALARSDTCIQTPVETQASARNVLFILLAGAPSHADTFDFKWTPGVTPTRSAPESIAGITWPTGIFPKLVQHLPKIAILRSMRAHALVHPLAQAWTQIGRSPAAVLGDVAPHVGSIVATELEAQRRPSDVLPTFLALDSDQARGAGYLGPAYEPLRASSKNTSIPNAVPPGGFAQFRQRWELLQKMDGLWEQPSSSGAPGEAVGSYGTAAKAIMESDAAQRTFQVSPEESARYGDGETGTPFGNACVIARQLLAAQIGTRFVQITLGEWDMHQDIYTGKSNIFTQGNLLDQTLAVLLKDLDADGLLRETLVVVLGEFGRTPWINSRGGRDHYAQQAALFAGAGIRGGRAIGSTNDDASALIDTGWSRQRPVWAEDVEATIYSALGINWTTTCYNDPQKRGFEYVPGSKDDLYGPIRELWM